MGNGRKPFEKIDVLDYDLESIDLEIRGENIADTDEYSDSESIGQASIIA